MVNEADDSSQIRNNNLTMMPPPPKPGPTVLSSSSSDRKMNDTTMPPPRYSATKTPSTVGTTTSPALKPKRGGGAGFGLHDWKRLLAASKDLAQLKGNPIRRDIPLDEIRSHNKNHDGWIIVRGNVYNIGPYLPYHPGGIDIFKHVLGKDATSMFDKYHRWVNIDGLIGPLMIGTAAPRGTATSNPFSVVPPKESHLTNAPRVSVAQVASSSALLSNNDDEYGEEEEQEESILPPAPK